MRRFKEEPETEEGMRGWRIKGEIRRKKRRRAFEGGSRKDETDQIFLYIHVHAFLISHLPFCIKKYFFFVNIFLPY